MLFVTTLKQSNEHILSMWDCEYLNDSFSTIGNTYENIEIFYVASSMIDDIYIYLLNVNACPYFQLVIKSNIKPLHGVCYNNQASTNELLWTDVDSTKSRLPISSCCDLPLTQLPTKVSLPKLSSSQRPTAT
jgi:hypothetical protein